VGQITLLVPFYSEHELGKDPRRWRKAGRIHSWLAQRPFSRIHLLPSMESAELPGSSPASCRAGAGVGTFHAVGPNSSALATATAAATTCVSSSGPRRVHIKRGS
jgi:hypothetical protein